MSLVLEHGEEPRQQAPQKQYSQTMARRGEIKYLLDERTYRAFRKAVQPYMEPDAFACAQISSIYLDTEDNALVRRSIEKPAYKEKLRIRTYRGEGTSDDTCFLELKKKFHGTVYKRRVQMTLAEAEAFCKDRSSPQDSLTQLSADQRTNAIQVLQEIEWLFSMYGTLTPSFMVSCRRLSLKERGSDSLRITFDRDIRWSPEVNTYVPEEAEEDLVAPGIRVMEIKATKALPLWLTHILDELEIYPRSFSKVGTSYKAWLTETKGKETTNEY